MFVPPENDSNTYYSSLVAALRDRDITLMEYSWNSLAPLLGPLHRHGRPDVIHLHWLHPLMLGPTWVRTASKSVRLLVSLSVIKLLGITVVWTVHNLASHEQPYPRLERLWRILIARLFADQLIVHCRTAVDQVRAEFRLGDRTPISVIPHGHYIGQYPQSGAQAVGSELFGDGSRHVVFTYFGQIRPYKQVPRLVEMFKQLDEERARLVVAGNPRTESLRREIERACSDREDIHTRLEFVPDDEVRTYFENADVVVLPYSDILTSGSAILAMSFARPVIAPRIGCLPELVDDGVDGFLYDPDEPDGLEQAMRRAIEAGPELSAMGQRGYNTVEKMDWATIADRTQRVYEA